MTGTLTFPSAWIKIKERWSSEDIPKGPKHFQIKLFAKDLLVYLGIPLLAVVIFKGCESAIQGSGSSNSSARAITIISTGREIKPQVIDFSGSSQSQANFLGLARRAPGTLVKVKLLNNLEAAGLTPVHVQVVDRSLGENMIGSTIVGEAVADEGLGRMLINFRFVRHRSRNDTAWAISARALSLDGTYGILAEKKEGFFARAALRSAQGDGSELQAGENFKSALARTLAAGLLQELQTEASYTYQRAQVFTLKPGSTFYIELTDFFPRDNR